VLAADEDEAHHPRVRRARPRLPPLRRAVRAREEDGGAVSKAKVQQKQKKQDTKPAAPKAPGTKSEETPRLLVTYRDKIVPQMTKEFEYENVMQVPRVAKVVVNVGIGEAKDNDKALDAAVGDVVTITGQKPALIKARKSVAAFKLRQGQTIGIKTTLRGRRMWYFLDKLLNIALPRIRDFRGVNPEGFDGRGNYSLGLREQVVFPEIDYDKIDKLRGLEVAIVTTARNDDEARSLLTRLGMPFRKR
jgi:large subunit ribosomal protein L5